METDTEGGKIAKKGWEILHDQSKHIIHAVSPAEGVDDPEPQSIGQN